MRRKRPYVLIASILLTMAVSSFSKVPERRGFFGGMGLGAGYVERTFDEASLDDERSRFYMDFFGGYAFNPHLAAGLEVSGWTYEPDNTTGYSNSSGSEPPEGEGLSQFFVFGRYYPSRESGLFLKLGGGYVHQWTNREGGDSHKDGWGAVTGIGYDYLISGHGSATLALDYGFGEAEDLNYQSISASISLMLHQWKGPLRFGNLFKSPERRIP